VAVHLLRLDPGRVTIASALANDRVADTETVAATAGRHGALAAINGGFFRENGDPLGVLKVKGELVSDSAAPKGAVVIRTPRDTPMSLTFDRLAAKVTMRCRSADAEWTVPIDGVDTTRQSNKLMLYTPAYDADTDTAPTGTEWVLDGTPLRVVGVRANAGHTVIPPKGAVLSFGGLTPPAPLAALGVDVEVSFEIGWRSEAGLSETELNEADHIVGGAGLLRQRGVQIRDWQVEALAADAFTDARHPRTLIGRDDQGAVWLVAVDGRQPDSIGMTFADLQRLADRLRLTDALNLDGGGSTTMVVRGQLINRPSDPGGARPVGDAILVLAR
jgi:hypothetical protein